ncbi:MAG TPA: MDR family MFS transporter [Oculatellaceae cyanobacterium]
MSETQTVDTSAPQSGGTPSFRSMPRRQLVGTIIGLQLTMLLAALDQTIVATAMPQIIARLNGFDRFAWVTSAYLLTSTAAVPIFGKLSDMYGRKLMLVYGAFFFVVTSALCGAAGQVPIPLDGMNQLIVGRALQGIAGGAVTACVFASIGDLFPPRERGKYMGLFAGVWGISSMIGPALGGWLSDTFSWRSIFYVNLPVGFLAVSALQMFYPKVNQGQVERKIDYFGSLLLIAFLVPLLIGLTATASVGWLAPPVLAAFAFSLVMFIMFVRTELRVPEPIISPMLLQLPEIRIGLLNLALVSIAMFDVVIFAPLYLQAVMGISATKAGSMFTPLMLTMSIGSTMSGQLVSRLGRYKYLALVGLSSAAVGLFLLSQVHGSASDTTMFVVLLTIIGGGMGVTMPIFTLSIQNAAPQGMIGSATALGHFCRSIGATLGSAILGSILQSRYTQGLQSEAQLIAALPPNVAGVVNNPARFVQMKSQLIAESAARGDMPVLNKVFATVASSLGSAINLNIFLGCIVVVVALLATALIKEKELKSE